MMAYTGRVRLDGPGRFVTTVDLAWNPAWTGEQLRFFSIDKDRLTIRTPEQTHPRHGNRLAIGDLVWVREVGLTQTSGNVPSQAAIGRQADIKPA
jgi:hypothetical protein